MEAPMQGQPAPDQGQAQGPSPEELIAAAGDLLMALQQAGAPPEALEMIQKGVDMLSGPGPQGAQPVETGGQPSQPVL